MKTISILIGYLGIRPRKLDGKFINGEINVRTFMSRHMCH